MLPSKAAVISELQIEKLFEGTKNEALSSMVFSLLRGKPIREIINFGYSLLGNPPLLVAAGTLIASPPNCEFANATFLDMIHRTAPECHEPLYVLSELEYTEKQKRSEAPLLIDCKHLGIRLIAAKIMCNDDIVAVIQVPESEKTFEKRDFLYVHLLAKFISGELSNTDSESFLKDMLFKSRFLAHLQGKRTQDMTWVDMLRRNDSTALCVAVVRMQPSEEESGDALTALLRDLYFCQGVPFGGEYVLLCMIDSGTQRVKLKDIFSRIIREKKAAVAVSAEFCDSTRIAAHYKQAKRALDTGLSRGADTGLFCYDEMSIDTVLFDASHYVDTEKYFDSVYSFLHTADRKNSTELAYTLKKYVELNFDKAEVSNALGIHRNTLAFRLKCIETLLGRNVSEGENLYALKFIDKIRRQPEINKEDK